LDIETAKLHEHIANPQAGLSPHLSKIRLVQVYGGGNRVFVFDLYWMDVKALAPLFTRQLVAHNALFEMKHLTHAGFNLNDVECTKLMANAVYGDLPSLAELSFRLFGWTISKELQVSDWDVQPLTQDQLEYAALDAVLVYKLYLALRDKLDDDQKAVYSLMRDSQHAIARVELNGIHFDQQAHADLVKRWIQEKEPIKKELEVLLAPDINLNSGKQLSDWIQNNLDKETIDRWPRTGKGRLQTDAETLERFITQPSIHALVKYKEYSNYLTFYGEGYAAHINPVTGRIHASFHLGGTITGRLSCSSPNVQNPLRDEVFRALFTAPLGRILVVADFNQIELQVAALVSGDEVMLEAYSTGIDLHKKTASVVMGVPIDMVGKQQRQLAKAVNFGLLYGQGAWGLAQYARTSYGVYMKIKTAQEAREAFFTTYKGLALWQEETKKQAESERKIKTPGGRVRYFPEDQKKIHFTEALNFPIQGGAAEVMLSALVRLTRSLDDLDALLVNVIHDEIILEVALDDAGKAMTILEESMKAGMLDIFPTACTQNLVEAKTGSNWASAKG
jgi:DNA polymerase-1